MGALSLLCQDNLLKEIEEADEKILMNAFTKSTKAKALQSSNIVH